MANSRTTRSSGASLSNGIPANGPDRGSDQTAKTAEKRRGAPHVTTPKRPTRQSNSAQTSPSSSEDGEEEDDGAEGDAEDDDMTDAHAPPSDQVEKDSKSRSYPVSHSPCSKRLPNKAKESWAGLPNELADHDAMIIDEKSDSSNELTDTVKDEDSSTVNSPSLKVDGDVSDAESATFDLPDDDDDYEAVDNVSTASDDSREFEADVEREIQAAGEDGIDWDDENTYNYDATLSYDLYGFGYESGMAQSLLDFDLFALDHINDMRLTQSAPALEELEQNSLKIETATHENMLALDRSVVSSESDSSMTPDVTPNLVSDSKTPSKSGRRVDDDGDTTDEDISWTTVSSPGVTLSRQNSNISRRLCKSAKPRRTGRQRPLLRRILPDPEKAIAYSVSAPFGSTVRFCTPKAKTYRWMDLRGSRNSSRASSPTMINLEDAYLHGNTRTGAHITDVINGTLFSALHCRSDSAPDGTEDMPAMSNFYRTLLADGAGAGAGAPQQLKASDKPVDDSALALIDFSGGVDESSPVDDALLTEPKSDSTAHAEESSMNLQIPMTPPPEFDIVMGGTSTSPKKRRLSNRSNDRRNANQATKKKRISISTDVLV